MHGTGPKGLIRPHDVLHFADSPHQQRSASTPPQPPSQPASPAPIQRLGGRVFATPYARKLAAERNVEITVSSHEFNKI